jgi:hypothetical protein
MKSNYYPLLLAICSFLFLLNIYQFMESKDNQIIHNNPNFDNPTFIWNDDLEGLPVDGTPIMLQYTEGDTIYLGVIEEANK